MMPARETGHSLVGVLVGMAVGLIVLGALSGIFISVKSSYRAQKQLERIASAELRVMQRLTHVVQSAGFQPAKEYSGSTRPQFAAQGTWQQGQSLAGQSGAEHAGDVISTRFRVSPAERIRDCGGGLPLVAGATSTFTQTMAVNRAGVLECRLADASGTVLATYAIAEGITRFEVRYGLDGDENGSIDQYLSHDAVTQTDAWRRVMIVRFSVSMRIDSVPGQPLQTWTQTVRMMNRE